MFICLWQGSLSDFIDQNINTSKHKKRSPKKEQRSWPRRSTVNSKYILKFSRQTFRCTSVLSASYRKDGGGKQSHKRNHFCNTYISCLGVIITTAIMIFYALDIFAYSYRNHVITFVLTNPFSIPGFDIVWQHRLTSCVTIIGSCNFQKEYIAPPLYTGHEWTF